MSLPYGRLGAHVAAVEWGARAATRRYLRGSTRRPGPALLRASLPVRGACTCTCGCGAQSGADGTRSGVPGVGQPPRPIGARRVAGLALTGRRIDRLPGYYCWRLRAGPGLATGRHQAVVTGGWLLFGVRMLPRACMLPVHTACMCMCMPTGRPAGRPWSYVHARGSKACMHGSRIDGSIGQCNSITVTRRGSQDVVVFTVVARVHAGVNRCCGGTLALQDTRDMTRHANACRNVTYNITQTGFYVRESTRGRSMDPAAIS